MITLRTRCVPAVLSLAAVLAMAAGCGSDDDRSASAAASSSTAGASAAAGSSSAAASSAAPSSTAASAADDAKRKDTFCRTAPGVLQSLQTELSSVQSDPQSAPQKLDDAVTLLDAVQPPAGVTPQWQRFVGAVTGLRDLVAKLDLNNPANNTQYADQLKALQPDLVDGGSAIDDWGKANC